MQEQQEKTIVVVNTVEQFATYMAHWHEQQLKETEHLLNIPEGSEIALDTGETKVLSGDFRDGFLYGLTTALIKFGDLPFTTNVPDATMH